MEAPPNYGPEYVQAFRKAFRDVASKERVLLIPFLLDKVAGQATLNQADGIHPNAEGARIVADTVWPVLALGSRPDGHGLVIELRGVSKTVPSGTGMLTILHPLDLDDPRRTRRRDHRPVRQRQVDAARADRRPRCAVDRARS